MQRPDYEYTGLLASSWDLMRGDTSVWKDRYFYKDVVAKSGQPVLDVGCGTGRLLLDFMGDGVDIEGVDNSPEMLALCREKAEKLGLEPVLYQQTMETLDLPRKYRTILVPSSSFQLVLEPSDADEAMRRFFKHLEPGGVLVMSFMINYEGKAIDDDWHAWPERVRAEDGAAVRRWTRTSYDAASQLESTEDRYEVVLDGEVIASEMHTRSPGVRWYTQQQVMDLYERAGFTGIRLIDGFSLEYEPAPAYARLFVALGVRP